MTFYTVLLRIDAHIEVEAEDEFEAEYMVLSLWNDSDEIMFDNIRIEEISEV